MPVISSTNASLLFLATSTFEPGRNTILANSIRDASSTVAPSTIKKIFDAGDSAP